MASVILIQAWPRNASTGAEVALRFAGGGSRAYNQLGFLDWRAGVVAPPRYSSAIAFEQVGFTGGAIPTTGAIAFNSSDQALSSEVGNYLWTDARLEITAGDDETGVYATTAKGKVAGASCDGGVLSITFADMSGDLTKMVVPDTFAGTGGVEGPTEATGRVKRRSWGRVFNVEARLINVAQNIYEVGDPSKPLQQIEIVRDKGRNGPLSVLAWQGSITATYDALVAASVPAGGAVVAPSIAMLKWWTVPSGPLTADLRGEVGAGYVETVATIANRLVGTFSTAITVGNLAEASGWSAAPAGIHAADQTESVGKLLDRLLAPMLWAWTISPAAVLTFSRLSFSAPVEALNAITISRNSTFAPLKQRIVGYQKNHRVHGDGEISSALLASDVVYEDGQTAQDLQPAEAGATNGASAAEKSQLAQLEIDTAQAQQDIADAQSQIAAIEGSVAADFSEVNSALAALNGEVDTAQSDIGSLQSTTGALGSSVATLQGEVSTAQSNISSLQSQAAGIISDVDGLESQITAQGGQISTLQSTVATQGAQVSTLQTTVSNAVGDVATLKTQVRAGGGNLLVNTDAATGLDGWDRGSNGGPTGVEFDRNMPDANYHPASENVFSIHQPDSTSSGYSEFAQHVAIKGGTYYDFSMLVAAHRCQVELIGQWENGSGGVLGYSTLGPQNAFGGGTNIGSFTLISFNTQAPSDAVRVRFYMRKYATLSGFGYTDSWAWFLRPQVAESVAGASSPVAYSPGSSRAAIAINAQAISAANSSIATLSTIVSTQGGYISTLQSSVTTLQGSVSTLESTVATQGASITSLQTAVSTAQGDLATIKTQISAGGGNLLQNTDFAIDAAGWAAYWNNNGSYSSGRNTLGDDWRPPNENVWVIGQDDANAGYYASFYTLAPIPVDPAKWYEWSGYVGAHRCSGNILVQFFNRDGTHIANHYGSGYSNLSYDGRMVGQYARPYLKMQPPAGSATCQMAFEKSATSSGSNSYVVILRPQMKEVLQGAASPTAYSIGGAGAVISQPATALSNLAGSFASLETRVSSAEGSVSTLQSSMTSANGSISTLQTNVSSLQGSVSTLQSSSSTQAGQISALQSTVSTQGGQISTNATAISTLTSSLSTLASVVSASSSPNLVKNGGFENALSGWTSHGLTFVQGGLNGFWGAYAIIQNLSNGFAYIESEEIDVPPNNPFALSMDFDVYGGAACHGYASITWFKSDHTAASTPEVVGGHKYAPHSFDNSGAGRSVLLATSPADAAFARVRAIFYAPSGQTITSGAIRQIKFEMSAVATPYSGEAGASQMFQAYSSLNASFASLSTTVATQGGSITTLQSSYTSLSGTVSTLNSTVSAQGASIGTLQTASASQAGQISILQTQVRAGGGNLLVNTDAAIGLDGWQWGSNGGPTGVEFDRNAPDGDWHPATENAFSIHQPDGTSSGYSEFAQYVSVKGGTYYDFSLLWGAHRCQVELIGQWENGSGGILGYSTLGQQGPAGGGPNLGSFVLTSFNTQAPSDAVRVRFYMRKYATQSGQADSWAWFMRPQVTESVAGAASPVAYSPGSSRAAIVSNSQAISTATASLATLSTTVSTQGGTITTLQSSMTTAQGNISTLQSTVSTQGASISSLQTTTSTLTGDVSTLTTRVNAGSGFNLIPNASFENGISGWTAGAPSWGTSYGSNWGSYGYASISGSYNGYVYIDTAHIDADAGGDFTAAFDWDIWGANGSSWEVWLEILYFNSGGAEVGRNYGPHVTGSGSRGFWYGNGGNQNRAAVKTTGTAPAGTARACVRMIAYGTEIGGFAVRQAKLERGTIATPYSAEASIVQSFSALSTLSGQYASLSTTVSTQGVTISSQATAITTIQGNVSTLFGQYVLSIDVNGKVAGMKLANNGGATSLAFRSDLVTFEGSSGTGERTEFSGGNWRVYNSSGTMKVRMGVWS